MTDSLTSHYQLLKQKYDLRWEVLDIILGGKSPIDIYEGGFNYQNSEEVGLFLSSYGYEVENPIELAEMKGNFRESLNITQKYFLYPGNPDGLKLEIPKKILELENPAQLFLMASLRFPDQGTDRPGLHLRDWACALLKIMHTITHVDKDLRTPYFSDIQQQILDRYYKVVHREEGSLYLGAADDPLRVKIIEFQTKPKKTRESTILKLLHKKENVAEELFDRVGIRLVTETRLDALRVLKFLKDKMLFVWPNIKSSRSRNTLVDIEKIKFKTNQLFARLDQGENISEAKFVEELDSSINSTPLSAENPHSSEFFRAIQFTSRQLIKLQNSAYNDIKELKNYLKKEKPPQELVDLIERIDLKYIQKEVRFFYPYEVQLMDRESYEESEKGLSAHTEYKKAQNLTALKRVMGNLVNAAR